MSKKKQGHEHFCGVEAAQASNATLVGLWFHSRKAGVIDWQGRVLRRLDTGSYVVQLFEWALGRPSVQQVVSFDQMQDWDFYPTDFAMRRAWSKSQGESEEDFEWSEKVVEALRA